MASNMSSSPQFWPINMLSDFLDGLLTANLIATVADHYKITNPSTPEEFLAYSNEAQAWN